MHLDLVELNLEQHKLTRFWESNRADIILREIEILTNKRITGDALLFIDEIQEIPAAIESLRYLYEERPEIPVIAAGSLLEFTLGASAFTMPVGRVEFYHLFPMTFEEVLEAKGETLLIEYLNSFDGKEFSHPAHEKLFSFWKEYLYVGGMPEAVRTFLESGSYKEVRNVHRSIVQTFRYDFGKYGKRNVGRIETVFEYVPLHPGEKIKYVNISQFGQARDLKDALDCLIKARIVYPVYQTNCGGIPLKSGMDVRIYKCFFMDIGLAVYMQGMEWRDFQAAPSELVNRGQLAEQFVAQHLVGKDEGLEEPELFYWLREGRSGNAEVDFIFNQGTAIVPVEVKAGKSGAIRSLHQFVHDKGAKRAVRFDANPPSIQRLRTQVRTRNGSEPVEYDLYSYPIYMAAQVFRGEND
jgi:hypothetical protein